MLELATLRYVTFYWCARMLGRLTICIDNAGPLWESAWRIVPIRRYIHITEKKLEFHWIYKVIYTTILQTLLDMQENLHLLDWFDFDIIFNKVRICKTNWFPFMWLGFLLHLFPKIGWNLFWRSIFHNFMHLCFHKTLLKPFLGILWKQR